MRTEWWPPSLSPNRKHENATRLNIKLKQSNFYTTVKFPSIAFCSLENLQDQTFTKQ